MNRTEHLLTVFSEECAEVSHRIAKALRFGLDERHPDYPESNAQMVTDELDDLIAVAEVLQAEGIIPMNSRQAIQAKKEKVKKYMAYSQEQGTLS